MKSQRKELRLRNARNHCRRLHDAAVDRHASEIDDAMKADPLLGRSVADVRGDEDLLAIADQAAAHLKHPYTDHAVLLYDENGLPK